MKLHITLILYLLGVTLTAAAKCSQNNCYRAVVGTGLGTAHSTVASLDCSSYLQGTLAPTLTVTTTEVTTVATTTLNIVKRSPLTDSGIPAYASPCTKPGSYESACSCLGVIAELTAPPVAVTVTANITATTTVDNGPTSSSTSRRPPPNCVGGTCGGFPSCGDNEECACFQSTINQSLNGYCGGNGFCDESATCATSDDCEAGSVCAINTCCPWPSEEQPGICLVAACDNVANRLGMMSKGMVLGGTAFF